MQPLPGIIFILCGARSGSTLLRVMLAGHSALFSPPELHMLPFYTMGDRQNDLEASPLSAGLPRALMELEALSADEAKARCAAWAAKDLPIHEAYAMLQSMASPRILVDKSPSYSASLEVLRRAEKLFEGSRFIHLVRHPYSTMESIVRMGFAREYAVGELDVERETEWRIAEFSWTRNNGNIVKFIESIDAARHLRICFEDLVARPEATMRALCRFLGLPYCEAMLRTHEGGRMTDGLTPGRPSLGDMDFLRRKKIDPALGERWKNVRLPGHPLSAMTEALAHGFGYDLTRGSPS